MFFVRKSGACVSVLSDNNMKGGLHRGQLLRMADIHFGERRLFEKEMNDKLTKLFGDVAWEEIGKLLNYTV